MKPILTLLEDSNFLENLLQDFASSCYPTENAMFGGLTGFRRVSGLGCRGTEEPVSCSTDTGSKSQTGSESVSTGIIEIPMFRLSNEVILPSFEISKLRIPSLLA